MSENPGTQPGRPARVLTVGAYERDNFGDLLFLLVTERYLAGSEVVASAPFAADMTELLDRRVVALGDELTDNDIDAVWTVGGQVGGTTVGSAFRMSKSRKEYAAYMASPPAEQREILKAALHGAPLASPYVPTPGSFPRNAAAVTVLNSVGLAGIQGLPPHLREEMIEVVRTTDAVSVRDVESSRWLGQCGIAHTLTPDVVHAIGLLEPYEADPTSDIAVVQAQTILLEKYGFARLGRNIAESSQLAGMRLQFLMAGAAAGHDSVKSLERLADEVRKVDPGREIEILTERRPLDIVHQIRQARVVIGTSLHVRIIAAAYGLPRVTLRRAKPAKYATHWDDTMPFNVRVTELDGAVGAALAAGERPEVRAASDELSRLADENVRAIADRVAELVARGRDPKREQLAERRQQRYHDISARRAACDVVTDQLRSELREAQLELERLHAEMAAAPTWRSMLRRRS